MLHRVFQKVGEEREPFLVFHDHRLFNRCNVDILNLPSRKQVGGASKNRSLFLGWCLARRVVSLFQTESQTEVKRKAHCLNHILEYTVLNEKITPAPALRSELGNRWQPSFFT